MLFRNRYGIWSSRPWRSNRKTVKFMSLNPPGPEGQDRAYRAAPKLFDSVPVVAAIRKIGDRDAPGVCEVWT